MVNTQNEVDMLMDLGMEAWELEQIESHAHHLPFYVCPTLGCEGQDHIFCIFFNSL